MLPDPHCCSSTAPWIQEAVTAQVSCSHISANAAEYRFALPSWAPHTLLLRRSQLSAQEAIYCFKILNPVLGVGEWPCNDFCTPKAMLAACITCWTDLEWQSFPNYPNAPEALRVFHKNARNTAYRNLVSLPSYLTVLWWQVSTAQNIQQHWVSPTETVLCSHPDNCQGKRQQHISATCRLYSFTKEKN